MSVMLYALHGFLGVPADFSQIKLPTDWQMNAIDYLHVRELSPENSLKDWGNNFCKFVLAKEKAVSGNTIVFNNLVNTVGEWQDFWEVPANESWHNRFF